MLATTRKDQDLVSSCCGHGFIQRTYFK